MVWNRLFKLWHPLTDAGINKDSSSSSNNSSISRIANHHSSSVFPFRLASNSSDNNKSDNRSANPPCVPEQSQELQVPTVSSSVSSSSSPSSCNNCFSDNFVLHVKPSNDPASFPRDTYSYLPDQHHPYPHPFPLTSFSASLVSNQEDLTVDTRGTQALKQTSPHILTTSSTTPDVKSSLPTTKPTATTTTTAAAAITSTITRQNQPPLTQQQQQQQHQPSIITATALLPGLVTVLTRSSSESPNKVHPKPDLSPSNFSFCSKGEAEDSEKPPKLDTFVVGGMNKRRSSMKKMSWLLGRGHNFLPVPQDDVGEDKYDNDDNETEEDLLLGPSDDDSSSYDLSGRYRGELNFGRSRSSSGSLRDRTGDGRDSALALEGRNPNLIPTSPQSSSATNSAETASTSKAATSSSTKAISGSSNTYYNYTGSVFDGNKGQGYQESRQHHDSRNYGGGIGGSGVGIDGGVRGGSGGGGGAEPKRGRVIATPWGAAWIGKRKKGVTYCYPDRKRLSPRAPEEQTSPGVKGKDAAEGYLGKGGKDTAAEGYGARRKDVIAEGFQANKALRTYDENKSPRSENVFRFDHTSRYFGCKLEDDDEDDDDDDDDGWGMAEHICDPSCPLLPHGDCLDLHSPGLSSVSGQRRSSFTSSTSRDSSFNSFTGRGHGVQGHGRRPRPLPALQMDETAGAGCSSALKSPGLLSTASMWSVSDLRQGSGNKATDTDGTSHGGTNSLSNVSGSFNERMHELVRAFSSRTQRAKEKISQPPTPSTDSDDDDVSGASVADDAPRIHRLASLFPGMGSGASDAFSDGNQDHFVGVWHCKFKTPKFFKKLRFPATIEPHSKLYVSWLFIVTLAFMYNACVIPLRGVFPYQTPQNVRYWLIADYFCDFIYLIDMLVFKVRLQFANKGITECDRKATKKHYMQKWMFKFDILSLTPLDLLYFIENVGVNPWLRLCRLLKIQTFWEFYEKCDQAASSSAHAIRIVKTMTYMLFLIHIETCGYYAVSVYEGIAINDWVYNGEGIAYIRCFYLATKTATSIGNNPKPVNELEFSFMTLYWLSGVFVFALLIGQIRDIVEAAGLVKDSYRKKMDACLWYMQSINMPNEMQERVRAWFLYNWDQQKTIDERSLVSSLPRKLQTDLAINVHYQTLSKVQLFQDCEKNLLLDLVLKLRPILFLPGDYICKKGEVGKEMYIVTQGQVEVVGGENNTTVLATLYEGSVFGEISLLAMPGRGNRRTADVRSKGFTNVFTLSKHDFEEAMTEYPEAQSMLKRRAKKLLKANAKMEKKNKSVGAEEIIKTPSDTPKLLRTVIQVMDPDSNVVKQLGSSLKRNRSVQHRPVSRSHSHRLSPSQSNLHHLTPPRSHSYRLASTRQSSQSLTNVTSSTQCPLPVQGHQAATVKATDRGVMDSDDDENEEELAFDDSSEDLSLSEVFRDAGAISSFDEDDDNDDDEDDDDGNTYSHDVVHKRLDNNTNDDDNNGDDEELLRLEQDGGNDEKAQRHREENGNNHPATSPNTSPITSPNTSRITSPQPSISPSSHSSNASTVSSPSSPTSSTSKSSPSSSSRRSSKSSKASLTSKGEGQRSSKRHGGRRSEASLTKVDASDENKLRVGVPGGAANNESDKERKRRERGGDDGGEKERRKPRSREVERNPDEDEEEEARRRKRSNSLLVGRMDDFGASDREDRRSERSKGESTIASEDSQDSGLPDVQRSDSRSSSGKKDAGPDGDSRRGSKTNSRTSRRGSRASDASDEKDLPGASRYPKSGGSDIPDDDSFEVQERKGKLDSSDSLENYIEKQIFTQKSDSDSNKLSAADQSVRIPTQQRQQQVPGSSAAAPQLRMTSEIPQRSSGSSKFKPAKVSPPEQRVRKLSVVSPPHSPSELKSPREKLEPSGHLWASGNRAQQFSSTFRDNVPHAAGRGFTPVETIQIRPLPPIEGSPLSMTSSGLFQRFAGTRSSSPVPSLTNGLEGCCGGGPLVDIPPENRVTCAVEIHGQKTGSGNITTTRDIHGHTETKL